MRGHDSMHRQRTAGATQQCLPGTSRWQSWTDSFKEQSTPTLHGGRLLFNLLVWRGVPERVAELIMLLPLAAGRALQAVLPAVRHWAGFNS